MLIHKYVERINLMHKLLKERRTGNPKEFAKRLKLSESRLYQLIEELRIMQVPVIYSKQLNSYYYEKPFHMEAHIFIYPLEETR